MMQNAAFFTDIRPIYNESATGIEGTLVTSTLRLLYYDKNRKIETLSLTIDIDDIRKLIKSGERAIKKGITAKEFLTDKGEKPVIIMGEK